MLKKIRFIMFIFLVIISLNNTLKASADVKEPDAADQQSEVASGREIPNAVINVLKNIQRYSEAAPEGKQLLCDYFQVKDEILGELDGKGYSITDSINMAILISKYDFTIDDMEKLLKNFQNIKTTVGELCKFDIIRNKEKLSGDKQDDYKKLLIEGYRIEEIRSADRMAEILDIDLGKLIRRDRKVNVQSIINTLDKKYNQKEKAIITSISKNYFIDTNYLLDCLNENQTTVEKAYEKIINYEIDKAKLENRDIKIETSAQETSSQVTQETQNTQDISGTEKINYNRYFNSPFDYKRNTNEKISPVSGSLTYESQDFSLPGRNGLDLNIVSRYESDKSNLYKPVLNYSAETVYEYDYDYNVYGKGTGYFLSRGYGNIVDFNNDTDNFIWQIGPNLREDFDVPWHNVGTYAEEIEAETAAENYMGITIDVLTEDPITLEKTYKMVDYVSYIEPFVAGIHEVTYYNYYEDIESSISSGLGLGWSFGFSSIEMDGDSKYLHLANGQAYRISMTPYGGDSNLEDYTLKDLNLEYDYGSHSNGEMSSAYVLMYKDGKSEYFADDGRLLTITDRYVNSITFNYEYIDGHPAISRITDSLGRIIYIQYNTTPTGREILIIPPNNAVIKYMLQPVPGFPDKYLLKEKIDANGNRTRFDYSIDQGNFSLLDKYNRSKTNYYGNLITVTYPTNAKSLYTYQMLIGNMGSAGSVEHYKVNTREEISSGVSYNRESYIYNRDYTGYAFYDDPQNLPEYFTYTTTIFNDNTNTEYVFNNRHLLINKQVSDNNQNTISGTDYEYNSNKLPIRVGIIYYGMNGSFSLRESFTDYNDYGDVTRHVNELGGETYYAYDPVFHLPSLTYSISDGEIVNKVEYGINPQSGNIDCMKKYHYENGIDKSILTEYSYDIYGNMRRESLTQLDGRITEKNYFYNSEYNYAYPIMISTNAGDYEGNTRTINEIYEYDYNTGNKTSYVNGNGKLYTYQYDNLGRLIEEINPDMTYKTIGYDDINNITTITNENSFSIRQQYDGLGRLIRKEEQGGSGWVLLEEKHYNTLGEVDWTRDASGNKTYYQYDLLGRLFKTIFADGTFTETEYIDSRDMKIEYDEERHAHYYTYDKAGNLTSEWEDRTDENNIPRQHRITYENNQFGKVRLVRDLSNNAVTEYAYDDLDRLISVENSLNEITRYEYDNLGNIIRQITAGGSVTDKYYDELGRLYQEKDPLQNSKFISYDGAGNIAKEMDRNGTIFSHIYDDLGRLKTIKNDTKNAIVNEYGYDPSGNMISAGNAQGTTFYEYYPNGKLKKEISPDGKYIYYEYNNDGTTSLMIDQFGKATTYGYDSRGRLSTVTIDGKTTTYQYYADGSRERVRYPEGTAEEYYYDESNNLTILINQKANGTIIDEYFYTYDEEGNQKSKTDKNGRTEYAYDALNRVESVLNPDNTKVTYEYDRNGNIDREVLSKISSGVESELCITDYVYDSALYRLDHVIKDPVKLNTLRISLTQAYVIADQQITFTLSGTMSNGSIASDELLNEAVWTSNSSLLTLNLTKGKSVTGIIQKASWNRMLSTDVITLKAELQGKTVEAKIYKNEIKTLTISPTEVYVSADQQMTFTLSGTMTDGNIAADNILNEAVWTLDSSSMTINTTKGKTVTGIITKAAWDAMTSSDVITLKATLQNKTIEARIYKNGIESLVIKPTEASVFADQQVTFSLSGTLRNGNTAADELLNEAVWTVDSTRMTLNTSQGKTVIGSIPKTEWDAMSSSDVIIVNATLQDKNVEARVYKNGLETLTITPTEIFMNADQQVLFMLHGTMKDGSSTLNSLLNESEWTVDSPYMILNTDIKYKVAGKIPKESWDAMPSNDVITVRVSLQDKIAEAKVHKNDIGSLTISPSIVYSKADGQITFTLSGKMKNGTSISSGILNTATWTSDSTKLTLNTTIGATITCVIPQASWDQMTETDTIKVRGTIGDVFAEASIKKDMAVVSELAITPSEVEVLADRLVTFTLSGEMSDGTIVPDTVLNTASWTSSNPNFILRAVQGKSIVGVVTRAGWTKIPINEEIIVSASVQGKTAQSIVRKRGYTGNSIDFSKTFASITSEPNDNIILPINKIITDTSETSNETANIADVNPPNGENNSNGESSITDGSITSIEEAQELNAIYDNPGNDEPLERMTLYYKYDNNGNIIEEKTIKASGEEITTYRYNELNQLDQITNSAGTTTYTYNPSGLRETKTSGLEETKYYYDGSNVIIETINNNFSARNIFGINPIARETNTSKLYYLYNGHADVVAMVDSSGNIINSYDYDIYGSIKEAIESGLQNPIRYAGQYYDSESDLYYLRARYYDPGLMRFISEDTNKGDVKDPLSLNLYVYCVGDPINSVDIDGNSPIPAWIQNMIDGVKAHKAIEAYVIIKLGEQGRVIKCNYFIPGAGQNKNYGFADLFDVNNKKIWEIKPDKELYKTEHGLMQLKSYVRNVKEGAFGDIILDGEFEVTGEDNQKYLVKQYDKYPGMLYYTKVEDNSNINQPSYKNMTQSDNSSMLMMLLLLLKSLLGGGNPVYMPV